jgi:hypothetical protein
MRSLDIFSGSGIAEKTCGSLSKSGGYNHGGRPSSPGLFYLLNKLAKMPTFKTERIVFEASRDLLGIVELSNFIARLPSRIPRRVGAEPVRLELLESSKVGMRSITTVQAIQYRMPLNAQTPNFQFQIN